MKISDLLRAGKWRIEQGGWCQGDEDAFSHEKGFCMATAVPCDDLKHCLNAIDFLKATNGFREDRPLAEWNDMPGRTIEEVYAAYDKAIAAAEEQENRE